MLYLRNELGHNLLPKPACLAPPEMLVWVAKVPDVNWPHFAGILNCD